MAIGDDAVAAGMSLVDGATTPANTIDTEENRTRDYIAQGKGATASATADKVVKRDSNGRASFATPTTTGHAATKGYVDGKVGTTASDIAAVKAVVDAASELNTPGTLLRRSPTSNRVNVGDPVNPANAATKGYVDDKVGSIDLSGYFPRSGGTVSGSIAVDGYFRSPNAYAATESYTVAYINGDGRIAKGASSERYKKYISDIDPAELGDVFPQLVRYQMRSGDGSWKYGYIAERLDESDDTRPFVVYNADGQPDSIDFIALLMVQNAQLHQQLDLLAQRLEALEERTV